jgi:hypothetical protein
VLNLDFFHQSPGTLHKIYGNSAPNPKQIAATAAPDNLWPCPQQFQADGLIV